MGRAMAKGRSVCRSAAIALFVSGLSALPAIARPAYEAILLDVQTGQVLTEINGDVSTPPASLTKMVTLHLTFEALKQGRLRVDQTLPVSDYAAGRAPSKLGLKPGEAISV